VTGGWRAAAALAAALAGLGSAAAAAAPAARVLSLRVVWTDGRTPAAGPYLRSRRYRYRVDYRVGGEALLRVTRRASLIDPSGRMVAAVRPPATVDDAGEYIVSAPIFVGPEDPKGRYVLRYLIEVRDGRGQRARARAQLSIPFR
jgi:hypothetical protein